ncbi:MAG: SGNH/GDSL hydrolase family protein [Chloroflexota bacterium]
MLRFTRALIPLLLALGVLLAPASGVRAEAPGGELLYLALGDSVPAGTDLPDAYSYAPRLGQYIANATGRSVNLLNRARAGERSAGVLDHQIGDVRAIQPELVTLTVGANDLLVPGIQCADATFDGDTRTQCAPGALLRALPIFERNYRAILRKLVNETGATIVVTTYFNPFPRTSRCAPGTTDVALRLLNTTIEDVAAEFGDRDVVVDLAPLFKGHEGREPDGWFSPSMSTPFACADIHPDATGHDAIAQAIFGALASRVSLSQ